MAEKITLEEYQAFVETTWLNADNPATNELRIMCGLIGELGEIAEKTKKYLRDGGDADDYRRGITLEFGDLLYYVAKYANFLDIELDDVLVANVMKLTNRKEKGNIKGSGDSR